MEEEIWKDIEGFEGLYQVSNLGRCKRFFGENYSQERLLKPNKGRFVLSKDNTQTMYAIDYLVAAYFVEKPERYIGKLIHIDGDKSNNCADNLMWKGAKNIKPKSAPQTIKQPNTNGTSTTTTNQTFKNVLENMLMGLVAKELDSINLLELNDDIPMKDKTITITDLCDKAFKYIIVNPISANRWLMKHGVVYNNDDNVKAPTVPYEKYYAEKTFIRDDYNKTEYHYYAVNEAGLAFILETIARGIRCGEVIAKIRQDKVKVKIMIEE